MRAGIAERRVGVVVALLLATAAHAAPPGSPRAQQVVRQAQASAPDIPGQALALAHLAWPEGPLDHEVAALARDKLVKYGVYSFPALFAALDWVAPRYQADVTAALLEARKLKRAGLPESYLPALEKAIWFGTPGARRLAIREVGRYGYLPAMLTTIDAAMENPQLTDLVVETLPKFRHAGARFYLGRILSGDDGEHRVLAARALARIGGRALETLRDASLSERREVRQTAIDALVPLTGINDLTTLHEYVALHPDDDPGIVERARQRAIHLEALLDESLEQDSSNPGDY